jgi:hypothetical protein
MKRVRSVWLVVDADGFPCPVCTWYDTEAEAKDWTRHPWCKDNRCAPGPHRIAKFAQEIQSHE